MTDRKRKYYSQLVDLLRTADVAIEIVDSRFIPETRIGKLERRFGKKVLIAASKADLVPKDRRDPGFIHFSVRSGEGIKELLAKASDMGHNNPYRRTKHSKVVIFGLPNVGKSSLINALKKTYSAKTGFRAGLTRGPQWIRLSENLMLCDTAGVLEIGENEAALALKAGLDVSDMKSPEQAAVMLITKSLLEGKTPKSNPIFAHYSIPGSLDAGEVLVQIARKRGFLGKGGAPIVSESAKVLVRDYQKGKFLVRGPARKPAAEE